MLEHTFRGARLLDARPPGGYPRGEGRTVWVPAWAYTVLLTFQGDSTLNLFQRTVLSLAHAGVRPAKDIQEAMQIPLEVVTRVQQELRAKLLLTSALMPTEEALELLGDPSRLRPPTSVIGVVYADAVQGGVLDVFVDPPVHHYELGLSDPYAPGGLGQNPLRPVCAPQWDEGHVLVALRRASHRTDPGAKHSGAHRGLPPNDRLEGARAVRTRPDPEPCWLRTSAYVPEYARAVSEAIVRRPFSRYPDPALTLYLHDAMETDSEFERSLSKQVRASDTDAGQSDARAVFANHDRAIDELNCQVGRGLARSPEVQRYLFNAVAGREMARLFKGWSHASIANRQWGAMSFYEPAVVNAARACEAMFKELYARYPISAPVERVPRHQVDEIRKEQDVRNDNQQIVARIAHSVGFATFKAGSGRSMADILGDRDRPRGDLKKEGLTPLILYTLLAAGEHKDHPFRGFAAKVPGGLLELTEMASKFRNPASHGSSESRKLKLTDAESVIETAVCLATYAYSES